MNEIEKELQIIKSNLINKLDLEAIILFGSYARNAQNDKSDIDIAIKSNKNLTKIELFNIKQVLEDLTKKEIDLINIANIDDGIRYEILMNGIIIYCKNQYEFDLYKLKMMKEYLELNESRKSIIDSIKNGGNTYGK